MQKKHISNDAQKMYTRHGKKRPQGIPIKANGKMALGYYEDGEVVGYTTLDEMNQMFYRNNLPEVELEF